MIIEPISAFERRDDMAAEGLAVPEYREIARVLQALSAELGSADRALTTPGARPEAVIAAVARVEAELHHHKHRRRR